MANELNDCKALLRLHKQPIYNAQHCQHNRECFDVELVKKLSKTR
jgi:hypothetical protein